MDDKKSWNVKEESLCQELVALLGLTGEESAALGALRAAAESLAPAMTEAFYGRLTAHGNTLEFFAGIDMSRMHEGTGRWFTDLFSGSYDDSYVQRRLAIGRTHVRIGLPVRYPLAMLDVVSAFGERAVSRSSHPEVGMRAFHKALALDVAIFNQAYEDNHLKHLAELVGGERLARRLLAGES